MKNEWLFRRKGYKCWYCGCDLTEENATTDHVIPNKDDDPDNLVPACKPCNSMKGTKSVDGLRDHLERKIFKLENGVWFSEEQRKYLEGEGFYLPFRHIKFHYEGSREKDLD